MIEATYEDKLKAMYLFGEEMSLVDSNANFVGQGLSKLESFVVQDIFSATCHFADVVLPASPSLEKEGTFTSTERRIQRLYQVFEPLEGSRPDWIIIQDIANRLGAAWKYQHPSEIYREIASLTPFVRRRDLREARRVQVSAVAGCSGWNGSATALHKRVCLPGWQSQTLPARAYRADGPAQCRIRSASE
jgi:predicted molibdopterin-dependent oxidoreductase YjgC